MRSCPNCLRSVAEEARVCRACYTVLPAPALRNKRSRGLSGLTRIFIIFAAAGGAWLFQLDVKLFPALRPAVEARIAEAQRSTDRFFGDGVQQAQERVENGEAQPGSYEAVQAKSVAREGRQCSIAQGIRNLDEKPLSRVALKFTFEDAFGNPIGSEIDAMIVTTLEAGAEGNFTFRLPCPRSFAKVEVRLPGESRKIALLPSGLVADAPESSAWRLAVQVSEPRICPAPNPCELLVRSRGDGATRYRFHREAKAPELLITEDSILIGHLRSGGVAWLQVPSHSGGAEILLTDQHLRPPRQSALARWVGKLF